MIICRGVNDTHTHRRTDGQTDNYLPHYSGISSHSKELVYLHNLVSSSDDELEAPGTELLSEEETPPRAEEMQQAWVDLRYHQGYADEQRGRQPLLPLRGQGPLGKQVSRAGGRTASSAPHDGGGDGRRR